MKSRKMLASVRHFLYNGKRQKLYQQPIAKLPKNEIMHSKTFCGDWPIFPSGNREAPGSSLHPRFDYVELVELLRNSDIHWCFAISIFSGTWNCRHYIQTNPFQKFLLRPRFDYIELDELLCNFGSPFTRVLQSAVIPFPYTVPRRIQRRPGCRCLK